MQGLHCQRSVKEKCETTSGCLGGPKRPRPTARAPQSGFERATRLGGYQLHIIKIAWALNFSSM